jgi:CDP-6-deoxy-D-xylo-4-hexulose-3-dehydrase
MFAGNVIKQPYMKSAAYRVSGTLINTDRIMSQTFWVGIHPSLTEEMLDFTASKIETFLGVSFD